MFNCPGWSQSGGPWVKPEQAMRYVAFSEQRVRGPADFEQKLGTPKDAFQEISVLAFPAPREDSGSLREFSPRITSSQELAQAAQMIDGDRATEVYFSGRPGNTFFTLTIELSKPLTARSLVLVPARSNFGAQCELQFRNEYGNFKTIRSFPIIVPITA